LLTFISLSLSLASFTSTPSFFRYCDFLLISFFFNDTATTEIYTLSLHDALPICGIAWCAGNCARNCFCARSSFTGRKDIPRTPRDRKSTRLNSSHVAISYAVFCLKKKNHKRIACILHTVSLIPRCPILVQQNRTW